MIFIGWFLRNAAVMSYRQHVIGSLLENVAAREIMTPDPDTVPADLSLRELVDEHFLRKRHQAFPVVDDGRTVGLITLQHVKEVPRAEWSARTVRQTMRGTEGIVIGPRDGVSKALEVMQDSGERRVLVMHEGRLAGLICASDVASWVQRTEELEPLR